MEYKESYEENPSTYDYSYLNNSAELRQQRFVYFVYGFIKIFEMFVLFFQTKKKKKMQMHESFII